MRTIVLLMITLAALSGCTDDADGDGGHGDGCDHLTGQAHDDCHAGQGGGGSGGGNGGGNGGGDGTGIMEPNQTNEVSITFTGTYPGTVTYDKTSVSVPANTTVILEFCNNDNAANPFGDHDLVVEGIEGAATDIIDGGTCTTVEFFSGPPQETKFFCSVGAHRSQGMEGDFVVV